MIDLADIQRVADLAKSYLAERKRYDRISERAFAAQSPKQSQKAAADLNWQAMGMIKLEAALHAACVDAGVADLREAEAYQEQILRPSGWHTYPFEPPKPRSLAA